MIINCNPDDDILKMITDPMQGTFDDNAEIIYHYTSPEGVIGILEKDDVNLITDVRFKSEVKGIKDLEGIIVRVNREGAGAGYHISEIDLDDYSFDYVINNNGSMEDLLLKVKEFCIIYNLI